MPEAEYPILSDVTLSESHLKMLSASAISADVITERGYLTTNDSALLAKYGFSQPQRRLGSGLLIPMYGANGQIVGAQFRPDTPSVNKDGKPRKYETPHGWKMRLDVLPSNRHALRDPDLEIWITEGIKKADALASLGLCAIGLIGVWNWRGRNEFGGSHSLSDWDDIALNDGRKVVLCFDSDYRDNVSVLLALTRLAGVLGRKGADVQWINLPPGDKLGVDDYLGRGHSLTDLEALKTSAMPEIPKINQAERLMAIAESHMKLLYASTGELLATVSYADGRRDVLTIGERGSSARNWLLRAYREANKGSIPGATALSQAMETLGAYCESNGEHVEVFTRVAGHDSKIYIDLGAPGDSSAIEITPDGWDIVRQPPVYFKRAPGMLPLPIPKPGGSIDALHQLFDLDPKSPEAMSITAWLLGTMHPEGPYTVLNLRGEQGSLKTTWTEALKYMIDPNLAPTRQPPSNEEDIVIAASKGHIIAFDNLSSISLSVSDMLSKLATGFGYGRRTLFRDSDETVFYLRRPVVFNGIPEIVTKGDLLQRLIPVELPVVGNGTHKQRKKIWADFLKMRPQVLGALLDAASASLKGHETVSLGGTTPRMADFMMWVEAAAETLGWEPLAFLNLHREQQDNAALIEIDSSPLAATLFSHLESLPENKKAGIGVGLKGPDGKEIPGVSAVDLLKELLDRHTDYDKKRPAKGFPETGNALGQHLRRLTPAFRKVGWEIIHKPTKTGRFWRIENIKSGDGVPTSTPSPEGPPRHQKAHPVTHPVTNNLLNDDFLSEKDRFGDGVTGFTPTSICRTKNKKEEKDLHGDSNLGEGLTPRHPVTLPPDELLDLLDEAKPAYARPARPACPMCGVVAGECSHMQHKNK